MLVILTRAVKLAEKLHSIFFNQNIIKIRIIFEFKSI